MSKAIRTRSVPRENSRVALKMAQQFCATAQDEMIKERWNSAGLSAIHCGISAADAALIHVAGVRSVSQDHANVSCLLEEHINSFRGSPRTQLVGLLKMKNDVAYEQRLITQKEARTLVTAAERFFAWANECCEQV